MTKSKHGERVYWAYTSQLQSFIKGSQDSNLVGAEEEAMVEDTYWLTLCVQAVSYTTQETICLGMAPATMSWALLHQLTNKKMPHSHAIGSNSSFLVTVVSAS